MDLGCIYFRTVISMKVAGTIVWSMEMELIRLLLVILTRAFIFKDSITVKAHLLGPQDKYTLVNLKTAWSMVKVNGDRIKIVKIATHTMVNMPMTWSKDTEFSNGQVATFTKESTLRTKGMAMARWLGLKAVATKAIGSKEFSTE